MLILFLGIYILLNLIILNKRPNIIINDIYWLLTSWIFIIGLYYMSGISYYYYLNINTIVYILSVLLIYICFRKIGVKIKIRRSIKDLTRNNIIEKKINTRPLFYLALFGLFLRLYDLIRLNSLSFGVKIHLASSYIGVIGSLFTPLAIVIWIYELTWALRYNKMPPFRSFISIIIYVLPVIIISGRINIIIILISSIITVFYGLKCNKGSNNILLSKAKKYFEKAVKPLLLISLLGIVYYSKFLAENRYGANLVGMFEYAGKSKISSETIDLFYIFGGFGNLLLNILHYYTHQLSTLEIIFNFYDGPYLYGMHQLHYLSRRLPEFLQLDSFLADYSFKDTVYYLGAPGFGSAWRTAIGSFIFDFGRFGTILFTAVLGLLVGQKRREFIRSGSVYETTFQVLVCVGVFFTIHYSPFYETSWAYAFYWMIVIPFFVRLNI